MLVNIKQQQANKEVYDVSRILRYGYVNMCIYIYISYIYIYVYII